MLTLFQFERPNKVSERFPLLSASFVENMIILEAIAYEDSSQRHRTYYSTNFSTPIQQEAAARTSYLYLLQGAFGEYKGFIFQSFLPDIETMDDGNVLCF